MLHMVSGSNLFGVLNAPVAITRQHFGDENMSVALKIGVNC